VELTRIRHVPTVRLTLSLDLPTLTLSPDLAIEGRLNPAVVLVARVLTELGVLYDVSHRAWTEEVPLVALLDEARRTYPLAPPEFPTVAGSYVWTTERVGRLSRDPPESPGSWDSYRFQTYKYVLRVRRVTYGSPFEIVLEIPWQEFAGLGGVWVFVKAVEHLFNAPGRISTERARLRAEEAGYRADERQNKLRQAFILGMLPALKQEEDQLHLRAGDLAIDDEPEEAGGERDQP
jgi:hypothetical protein